MSRPTRACSLRTTLGAKAAPPQGRTPGPWQLLRCSSEAVSAAGSGRVLRRRRRGSAASDGSCCVATLRAVPRRGAEEGEEAGDPLGRAMGLHPGGYRSPPYLTEESLLAEDVAYSNALWECRGRDQYLNAIGSARRRQKRMLPRVQYDVLQVSRLSAAELRIRWSISWVPPSLERLVSLGEALPWITVKYVDILDRLEQESRFTWSAFARFLARAVFRGEVRIPLAVILGSTSMQMSGETGDDSSVKVCRIVETWEIVALVRSLRLKNRRAARDTAEFMDTYQPPWMSFPDWEELVSAKVDLSDVPGANPLDVEGIDEGTVDSISDFLFLLTVAVLIVGGAAAYVVYVRIMQEQGQF